MEHRNSTVMTAAAIDRDERARPARHRRARVLPLLERRAHPAAGPRAVRFRSREHVGRAVAGRRLHAVLRSAGAAARRLVDLASTRADVRRPRRERRRSSPARLVRSAEEMSRMAPFIDGGRTDRSHELVEHGHLVLPVRRRDRAGARSVAARSHRRPRHARRLHARDVAHVRQARRQRAKATSIIRTRSPTPRRRSPRSAATARSRTTSSRATSRATTSPTTRGCSRAPGFTVRKRNAGRAWLGDLRLESRSGGCASRRSSRRPGRSTRPASIRTMSCSRLDGQRIASADDVAAVLRAAQARRSRVESCSSIAPARPKTASVTLAEDPHVEVVPRRSDGRHADGRAEGVPRRAGSDPSR